MDQLAREGKHEEALALLDSIVKLDPWMESEPSVVYPRAVIHVGLRKYDVAEALFKKAITLDLSPAKRAEAYYFLTALCGDRPEAVEWKAKALASFELAPELRAKLQDR